MEGLIGSSQLLGICVISISEFTAGHHLAKGKKGHIIQCLKSVEIVFFFHAFEWKGTF